MSINCIGNLTVESMTFAINSVAFKAYSRHKSELPYTMEQRVEAYKSLLAAVSNSKYDGKLDDRIKAMLAARANGDDVVESKLEMVLMNSMQQVQNSIDTLKDLDLEASVNPLSHKFPGGPEVFRSAFNAFITQEVAPDVPLLEEFVEESTGMPEEDSEDATEDIDTPSSISEELRVSIPTKFMDPVIELLRYAVSNTWVDSRVIGDKAKGFTSQKDVAVRVKSQLEARIHSYFADRSVGTFTGVFNAVQTHYIVLDKMPVEFIKDEAKSTDSVTVGAHKYFNSMISEDGVVEDVVFLIAPSEGEGVKFIKSVEVDTMMFNRKSNFSDLEDFTEVSFTNGDQMEKLANGVDLPVYLAHLLTSRNNWENILKAHYPSLSKAWKSNHKTAYGEPGSASGEDQDSAAQRLHKLSTPRLTIDRAGKIRVDEETPFLSVEDFSLVATELSSIGNNLEDFRNELNPKKELGITGVQTSANKKSILTSIYYRFFSPEDYIVDNYLDTSSGKRVSTTMRSYNSIYEKQSKLDIDPESYALGHGRDMPSPNALLDMSLSSSLTSMRSIKVNEQWGERQGRLDKTNIAGNGLDIHNFYQRFIENTTQISGKRKRTENRYFRDKRVSVENMPDSSAEANVFKIQVKTPDGKSGIVYTVKLNVTDDKKFDSGIPLTILNRSTDAPLAEVAKLFSKFGFPSQITNPRYLSLVDESIKTKGLDNEKNIGEITNTNGNTIDTTVDNLYINMLFTMILNAKPGQTTLNSLGINLPPRSPASEEMFYNSASALYGYKSAIAEIMQRAEGEGAGKFSKGYSGNREAVMTTLSHMKLTKKLADDIAPGSINSGSVLSKEGGRTPIYRVGEQTFGKRGMLLGLDVKDVKNLTEKENSMLLIETAFLQQVKFSLKHSSALIQIGTQADRVNPQATEFIATDSDGIFIKETIDEKMKNGWSPSLWVDDSKKLAELWGLNSEDTMFKAANNHTALQSLLKDHKTPYNTLKNQTNILQYGRVREDGDGFAYVSNAALQSNNNLDSYALARRALYVHQNYYSNLSSVALKEWNIALGSEHSTLQEVAKLLESNAIEYDTIKAESELVEMSMITKKRVDGIDYARVPEDILQSIAVFENDTLGLDYIEVMRSMFYEQLKASGYETLSPSAVRNVASVMNVAELKEPTARKILFDSYFYNSQILGVSALNLHTGGTAQFTVKDKSRPMFNTAKSFVVSGKDANTMKSIHKLDPTSVLNMAKNLEVPGSDLTLENISKEELIKLRAVHKGQRMERLAYAKIILENDSFESDADKAKALILNDLTRHLHDKLITQVKRNAVLGSSMQMMRLAGKNEPGAFLGQSSKVVVVIDDEPDLKVLGLSGAGPTTATDGVQGYHPIYELKYNNSVGGNESSFKSNGVAIKSLTIEVDANGSFRTQKKAEFGMFSNDMLLKGDTSVYDTLIKMNRAVKFSSTVMLVDPKVMPTKAEDIVWNNVDAESWKTHGISYDMLYNTNTGEMVSARRLKSGMVNKSDRARFENELNSGVYKTSKEEHVFNDMQELWEYHDSHKNENAWAIITDLISNHSGPETADIGLSDAVYPNRDAYIEKVGYLSQEKSGAKNTITWKNFIDPTYEFTAVKEDGKIVKRFSEVSNAHHGSMLQAEHGYDTTASHESWANTTDGAHTEDNRVSMISQILSANSAEGVSTKESENINNTLGTLTRVALEGKLQKIINAVIKLDPSIDDADGEGRKDLKARLMGEAPGNPDDIDILIYEVLTDYASNLIRKALSKRETDGGLALELLSERFRGELTFDQKQLLPLTQSQIFADYDREAVKMKLAGGQFVVSPAHKFLPYYNLELGGKTILSGLTRQDMNNHFYGENYANLPEAERNAIEESFPLRLITNFSQLKLSDKVVGDGGVEIEYIDLRNAYRKEYTDTSVPFEVFMRQVLTTNGYKFRFNDINSKNEHALKWNQVERYNKLGEKVNALDTDEYKAFYLVSEIEKSFGSKNFEDFFGIDTTKVPAAKKGKKSKDLIYPPELLDDIKNKLPLGLVREYYFDTVGGKSTDLISPTEENSFKAWVGEQDPVDLIESVYNYIGTGTKKDPVFKKRLEKHLYNLLKDDSMGWGVVPAETYMPHMHANAFLLAETDTLFDIIKMSEIPNTDKLKSMKILRPSEARALSLDYNKAMFAETGMGNRPGFKAEGGRYYELEAHEKMIFDQYEEGMTKLLGNTNHFFTNRLSDLYSLDRAEGVTGAKALLFVFNDYDLSSMIYNAEKKRDLSKTVGDSHYQAMSALASQLRVVRSDQTLSEEDKSTRAREILGEVRTKFISNKSSILSNNFSRSLDFITARIPAQGKQNYTTARIKNFIFSTKNSMYGPSEFVLVSGLDFDIDKQNMMTWSVDDDGQIIDWEQYMDNGAMSAAKLRINIEEDAEIIRDNFYPKIRGAEKNLRDAKVFKENSPEHGEEATKANENILRIEKKLDDLKASMDKRILLSEDSNRKRFIKAGQNFIVQNLMDTINNPKNAIEASTPVGASKIANAAPQAPIEHLFSSPIGLHNLFISQGITSNINPFSTIQNEKVTMDGKNGIGIVASDLKSYHAAAYATMTATGDEQHRVEFKSDLPTISDDITKVFGLDYKALQFFKPINLALNTKWSSTEQYVDGDTVTTDKHTYSAIGTPPIGTSVTNRDYWSLDFFSTSFKYMANTDRWMDAGAKASEEVKAQIEILKRLDPNKAEDQDRMADILDKFTLKAIDINNANTAEQAWQDLSELLTAATDNAKEMILGKIGANNTTLSLITTMVKTGVDLIDALDIINAPSIKKIVSDILNDEDLKTKAEKSAKSKEITIEEFNKKLVDRLKPPSKPGSQASYEVVHNYLVSPERQLLTYAKAAQEFSLLGKFLSINQGLKNSAFDVSAFIATINTQFNKSIEDYNKKHTSSKIDYTYDLAEVVKNMSDAQESELNETAVDGMNELYDAMDKIKTLINVPFILAKNTHYAGYLTAMFRAKNIRDRLSYHNSKIEDYITSKKELGSYKATTERMYKGLSDTLYEFGIIRYLGDSSTAARVTLDGNEYNLSLPEEVNGIKGRYELLRDMPMIIQKYDTNALIAALKPDAAKADLTTGIVLKILKGPDLTSMSSIKRSKLEDGLAEIEAADSELHRALFYYSLITTRGGFGGGSFMDLFKIEEYVGYSKYLANNSSTIINSFDNNPELITLLNPAFLKQVDTIRKKGVTPDYNEYLDSYDIETGYEPEAEEFISTRNSFVDRRTLVKQNYFLDDLNRSKRDGDLKEDYVQSKTNGLMYKWNVDLGIFVPVIRPLPNVGIPYRIPEIESTDVVNDGGMVFGIPVNLPGVEKRKGNVITYISSGMVADAANEDSHMKDALKDIINSDIRLKNIKVGNYIVADESGNYSVLSATDSEFVRINPGYIFDENRIVVGSKTLDNDEDVIPYKTKVFKKDGKYFSYQPGGAEEIAIDLHVIANDSTNTIYDKKTVKSILSKITKAKDNSYNENTVNTQYKSYVDQLINNLVAVELDRTTEEVRAIRNKLSRQSVNIITKIKTIETGVYKRLGETPSMLDKINLLMKGDEGFAEIYQAKQSVSKYYSSSPNVKYPAEGTIPIALYNYISGPDAQNNITMLPIGKFRNLIGMLGVGPEVFDSYVSSVMLAKENKIDALRLNAGDMFLAKNHKISASKQISSLNDAEKKSKPIYIPAGMKYEYTRPASKAVLGSLAKHLNGRLPGVKWKILSSVEIESQYGKEFITAKGMFKASGEVIINSDKATIETPLHEFGHIYLQYLAIEDSVKYNETMKLASEHGLFRTMKESYKGLSDIDLSEEVFCELLSMSATGKLISNNDPTTEKILSSMSTHESRFGAIKRVFRKIVNKLFGIKTDINLNMSDSLSSIIGRLSDDILFGKTSMLAGFSEKTKDAIKKTRGGAELTFKEAKDVLLARGYIQWFCV